MKNHIWITTMFFVVLVCAVLSGTEETVHAETYGGTA